MRDGFDRERGGGREDHAHAEAADEQPGDDTAAGGGSGQAGLGQGASGDQHKRYGQGVAREEAAQPVSGHQRDGHGRDGAGQYDQPRLQRGQAGQGLQPDRGIGHEPVGGEHADEDRDEGGGERRAAQQRQVQDRVVARVLPQHERDQGQGRDQEGGEGPGAAPARGGSADRTVEQGAGEQREQQYSGHVQARALAARPARWRRHRPGGQDDGRDTDRDVDEEDPAPAERLRQDAAGQRAEGGPAGGDRTPRAQGRGPLASAVGVAQQGDGGGVDPGSAGALHDAHGDQQSGGGRQPADQRGEREHRQPREVDAALAPSVGQGADGEQRRRQGQGVAVDDPGECIQGGVQGSGDVRQGHQGDGFVYYQHECAHADREQGSPLTHDPGTLYLPFRDRPWPQCPARADSFALTIPRDSLADVAVAWIMELTVTWSTFYGRNRHPRRA